MRKREFCGALELAAIETMELGRPSPRMLPLGARLLDGWHAPEHGAVLFWVDREIDLYGLGETTLHHVDFDRVDGLWQHRAGAGQGVGTLAQTLAERGPGLHRLGSGSHDPVRVTVALASPEVAVIELRSKYATTQRQPGVDGFCLLGVTHHDPVTYACPLDAGGVPLPFESLLL